MFGFLRNLFGPGAERIAPADAVTMVKKNRAVLLDVRNPGELRAGFAKGAVNIPMGELRARADPDNPACHGDLERAKPVIIYCATGARSGMAGRVLRRLGYEQVYNLGSLRDWVAGGGRTRH